MVDREFDIVIEQDEDGIFVASVPELPGCHSDGRTMEELLSNVREAIELYLEVEGHHEPGVRFVGVQRVVVSA